MVAGNTAQRPGCFTGQTTLLTDETGLAGLLFFAFPSPLVCPTPQPSLVQGGWPPEMTPPAHQNLVSSGLSPCPCSVVVNSLAVKVEHLPACSDILLAQPTESCFSPTGEQQPAS